MRVIEECPGFAFGSLFGGSTSGGGLKEFAEFGGQDLIAGRVEVDAVGE